MGASASFSTLEDDSQFSVFVVSSFSKNPSASSTILNSLTPCLLLIHPMQRMKSMYEQDYEAKIKAGEMTEADALQELRAKAEYLIFQESEAKIQRNMHGLEVGDVVMANSKEGVIVEVHFENNSVHFDTGEDILTLPVGEVTLVKRGSEFETGDKVEVRADGSALYVSGFLEKINADGTLDVKLVKDADDSDEEDDWERNVSPANARKLKTGRKLAIMRWKKAFNAITAMKKFNSQRLTSLKKDDHEGLMNVFKNQGGTEEELLKGINHTHEDEED
jgi:hypothetical protein